MQVFCSFGLRVYVAVTALGVPRLPSSYALLFNPSHGPSAVVAAAYICDMLLTYDMLRCAKNKGRFCAVLYAADAACTKSMGSLVYFGFAWRLLGPPAPRTQHAAQRRRRRRRRRVRGGWRGDAALGGATVIQPRRPELRAGTRVQTVELKFSLVSPRGSPKDPSGRELQI